VARPVPHAPALLGAGPRNAGSMVINPHVIQNPGWSPLRDLAAATMVAETPNIVVVNASLPVQSIRDLVDYVRARPGQINYGSAGSASRNRLEMEVFMREQRMEVVNVPYRGGAGPAVNGLMAGDVHMMFVTLPSVAAAIRGNRVRALAVTTAERFPGLPDVPTLAEQGYPQNISSSCQGLYAPGATPPAIVQRIRDGFARAGADEGVKQRLVEAGAVSSISESPAAFARFTAAEFERWGRVVREIGVTPD